MAEQGDIENVPAEEAAEEPAVTAEPVQAAASGAARAGGPAERREARAQARHREASGRGARSPQERQAEREAARAAKAAARRRRRTKERERRAAAGPSEAPPAPAVERRTGSPKVRLGRVVSDRADKTIVVRIDNARRHRRYEKIVRTSTTLHAHDEANQANQGDVVRVVESRPLSRTKRWRLVEVVERAR